MTVSDIRLLLEFNFWANAKMLQSLESVPEEKLYEDLKSSFGGIHATLVHMCGAEDIWLQRLTNVTPAVYMKKESYPAIGAVRIKWKEVDEGYKKYLSALTEDELARDFEITTQKGDRFSQKVRESLQHLVNHSSYHRGQITTMLRQIGGTPVGTDMITFYRLKNSGR